MAKDRHRPGYYEEYSRKRGKKDRHRPGYYTEYNLKHPERLKIIGINVENKQYEKNKEEKKMNRERFVKIVRHGRNLILHLKGVGYDKIEFEGKLEEYRDYKEYWFKRLFEEGNFSTKEIRKFKDFDTVTFVYGYTKGRIDLRNELETDPQSFLQLFEDIVFNEKNLTDEQLKQFHQLCNNQVIYLQKEAHRRGMEL